ncbi:MAG: hypothetical protein ACRBB2_03645 [Nitrosopumilus sp.]
MVVGIPISFVSPSDGTLLDPPLYLLFYISIAGMSVIIIYSSYTDRKERQQANAKRKSKK